MLPSGSLATLDPCPGVHPFGMWGQDGSTSNFGTSRGCVWRACAAAVFPRPSWPSPMTPVTNASNATPAQIVCFMAALLALLDLLIKNRPQKPVKHRLDQHDTEIAI